jgi:hypothetical protein
MKQAGRQSLWSVVLLTLLVAGAAGAQSGLQGRPRIQVRFTAPAGMKVSFQSATGQFEKEPRIEVPGRINLRAGCTYRIKLTDIPNRPGVHLYPTLTIGQPGPQATALLAHLAVPVEFSDEDLDRVAEGEFVTRAVFLPARGAGANEGMGTTTFSGNSGAAVQEAARQGTILAIIRIGNIDLEAPRP